MEAWLRAVLAVIPQPFRTPASLLVGALIRVWQWSDGLARRTRSVWDPMWIAAHFLRNGIATLGLETLNTLRWLVTVRLPKLFKTAVDSAVKWAADHIIAVANQAKSLVDNLRRWATDRIREALTAIDGLRRWAAGLLAELKSGVSRLLGMVFGTWATPARLAAWLAGAMWSALWRYGWQQADRIAEAAWRARRTLALRTIAEIEHIIGRIL